MVISGVTNGEYRLVFFNPEMLVQKKWRLLLTTPYYTENLRAIVIDEAHVVKNW